MKNKKQRHAFDGVLFIEAFAIMFAGFVLCNISAITIDCLFNGFQSFANRLFELPYFLYLLFSLIISFIFTLLIEKLKK